MTLYTILFNKSNIILMTTSVSPRLNIFCIMFKIIAFFIITLFARLYARVGILLTYRYGKHLHDCIISVRGEVCAHKPGLTTPRFIKVPDLYQARKVDGHVYVGLGNWFCLFQRLWFGNYSEWYFLFYLKHLFLVLIPSGKNIPESSLIFW